jgi:hypothetical protein
MTYSISGLCADDFAPLFALDDTELAARGAVRVTASVSFGFPCRVSLEDAPLGEQLILLHHTSHDVATPYRSAYAIYVREGAVRAGPFIDTTPPVFAGRPLALRGFDDGGMLRDAKLAAPDRADESIRALFDDRRVAYIDVHNAAHGCFAARVQRHEEQQA